MLFIRGNEKSPLKDKPLSPRVPAVFSQTELAIQPVELPATAYYPGLQSFVGDESVAAAVAEFQSASNGCTAAQQALENARSQLLAFQSASGNAPPKTPVLVDDFSIARPEVWDNGVGDWQYQDGHVVQLDPADTMCSLKSVQSHPSDFVARLKFRITGGDTYKSAGFAFDAKDEQNFSFIYASAGDSKLQVAHRVAGTDQYPSSGMKPLGIELDRDLELQINVHGQQVDVAVNGELRLTYTLPNPRPAEGHFHIWTYDATAVFRSLEITDGLELSEAGLTAVIQQAESAARLAEKRLAVAAAAQDFAKARIAADRANYASSPSVDAKDLSLAAGMAERVLSLHQEELKLLTAENLLATARAALPAAEAPADEQKTKAVTDAEAAITAARTAVEAAQKAVAEPFEAYTRITPVYPASSTGRRLALSRWIASRDNPLTARVAVNHIWMRHFHQPLVPTVFDFGMNGKPASHPELLDWLACELMDNGWKMKPLHRLIVTSGAYRMQSIPSATSLGIASVNAAADSDNRMLWRQNSHRMEAEVVRDAVLHVAGQLDLTMSGPDLDPNDGQTPARRSVYFRTSKEKKMTFLSTFDRPNPVECYQRAESISPQQSLAMSNSPLTLTQSRIAAAKLSEQIAEVPPESAPGEFVIMAFRRILSRDPTEAEQIECARFLHEQSERFASGSNRSAFPGSSDNSVKPSPDASQRARENLVHVLFNHNDFVTVR